MGPDSRWCVRSGMAHALQDRQIRLLLGDLMRVTAKGRIGAREAERVLQQTTERPASSAQLAKVCRVQWSETGRTRDFPASSTH